LLAIHDSLNESDVQGDASPMQRAHERQALAELSLWLEHMNADFSALGDLTTFARRRLEASESASPAHVSQAERREELELWRSHQADQGGLRTLSYATRLPSEDVRLPWPVTAGLKVARGMKLPVRALYEALLITDAIPYGPEKARDLATRARVGIDALALPPTLLALHTRPALLFEFAYGACAVGAFENPNARDTRSVPELLLTGTTQAMDPSSISAADSDGVVNTLSMLWPHDADPQLHAAFFVRADHADVIGHYRRRPSLVSTEHGTENAPEQGTENASENASEQASEQGSEPAASPNSDRLYDAYDLFESGSGFDDARFGQLWRGIFAFAFRD
jgi:hypothetical protein